jgi:regulation of enolase protein 1 (concanavalin A-like superfamily)
VRDIEWHEMEWLNEPPSVRVEREGLVVETGLETDFWRSTSYGFVHHSGHLLAAPMAPESALEVTFKAALSEPFDQAGLMLYGSPELWLKTGVERSDGRLYASVVVTVGHSDWSVAALPPRAEGRPLTFRASRVGDAVTVRYRIDEEPAWELLRVAYLPADAEVIAGPMCCSPSRAGLSVRFDSARSGPPDAELHAG